MRNDADKVEMSESERFSPAAIAAKFFLGVNYAR